MATESKASSFLAGVKTEITDLFASAYDEIASDFGEEVPPVIGETMQKLQKKLWSDVIEQKLKESYLNGKKASGERPRKPSAAHDAPAVSEPRANPFRRS